MICIKNGMLHTAITKDVFVADLLIDHGKIVKIGKNISAENAEEIDASGSHVYPGFIDAHCHIGIADRVGSLEEGKDADIVIVDGSPFELTGVIRHVLIDGKEVE